MRFFLSFLFALLLVGAGIAFMTMSSAEQGGWGLSLSMPGKDPAIAPDTPAPQESIELAQASQPQAAPTATGVPPQQMPGEPIGDWLLNCATNPQTSAKRCSIVQRILNNQSNSVVFAWVIGNDDQGNLVAVWQTPTGVLINRGVAIDVGTEKPIAVPYTACITGHCEAVATLAPDFVETLIKAEKATATIIAVSGQGLTFDLSVKGLSDGIAALKKATVDG